MLHHDFIKKEIVSDQRKGESQMEILRNIYLPAILVMLGLAFVSSQPVFADEDEQDRGGDSIWHAKGREITTSLDGIRWRTISASIM